MTQDQWTLVHDAVFPYGDVGIHYMVHARAYENGPDIDPVVILGQFGDHTGPALGISANEAAATAQTLRYPRGRQLRFVAMTPHPWEPTQPLRFNELNLPPRRRRRALCRRWRGKLAQRGQKWHATFTQVSPEGVTRHVVPTITPN